MRHIRTVRPADMAPLRLIPLVSLFASLVLLAPALGQSPDPVKPGSGAPAPSPRPGEVPEAGGPGFVLVPPDLIAALDEDAEHHFNRARDYLLAGNRRQSAREIRKGANLFRLEAARAGKADREAIAVQTDALEDLARNVEAGSASEPAELGTFARAHAALARHHFNQARTDWEAHDPATVAGDLTGALHHIASAETWIGLKRSEEEWLPMADLAGLADRMRDRLGWKKEEVEAGLIHLDRELARLDQALAP